MQRKIKLKICGITRLKDLDYCVEQQVEYVGFNFFRGSKRYIQPEVAARLWANQSVPAATHRNSSTCAVGVFVDSSRIEIAQAMKAFPGLDVLQFHGAEPDDMICWAQKNFPRLSIWRAAPILEESDLCRAVGSFRATPVDLVLLDAATSSSGAANQSYGGTGKSFDWGMLKGINLGMIYGVAGGIKPNSIPLLFGTNLGPGFSLIDVASGAESSPGIKDEALMGQIINAVRNGS